MASITLTIPDELVPRVMDAMRSRYPNLTDGLSDGEAARVVIRALVREVVREEEMAAAEVARIYEVQQAGDAADAATESIS